MKHAMCPECPERQHHPPRFPVLQRKVHGKALIWLDNAATTHKPQAVIDRLSRFYEHENSNIHRGTHTLAEEARDLCEAASTGSVYNTQAQRNAGRGAAQNQLRR